LSAAFDTEHLDNARASSCTAPIASHQRPQAPAHPCWIGGEQIGWVSEEAGLTLSHCLPAQLGLRPSQLLPMLRPFERYGNTSSSSTWYAWSFVETCQGVKRGQRLWQLSFGSGFKCASAAWTALRDCNEQHDAWTETPSC